MSSVLAISEHRQDELQDISFQTITAGRELTKESSGELHVAVINGDTETFASELNKEGVETIHRVDHGDEFNHDVYVQSIEALYEEINPTYLLMPHSVNGWDYAPAVANRLDLPLVTDVFDFNLNGEFQLTREMYASKVETTVNVTGDQAAITVRPGEWNEAESEGNATVSEFDVSIDEEKVRSQVKGYEAAEVGDVDISEAEFIVSIGRGIEEEDNLDLIEGLVDTLGATLGASRPLTDNGWLPKNRQVGQSGKVVTPTVYIAIGISGAVQHVAGMKGSETIVAVNTDPDAPIFDIADYGIVGDLFEVVPELEEQFS